MGALTNLLRGEGCSDRVLLGLLKHVVHVPVHYRRLPCAPAPQSTGGRRPDVAAGARARAGHPPTPCWPSRTTLTSTLRTRAGVSPTCAAAAAPCWPNAARGAARPPHLAMASAAAGRPVRRARHSRRWARPRRGRDAMAAAQRVLEPGGLRPEREGLAWKPAYSPPSVILAALTSSHPPTPPVPRARRLHVRLRLASDGMQQPVRRVRLRVPLLEVPDGWDLVPSVLRSSTECPAVPEEATRSGSIGPPPSGWKQALKGGRSETRLPQLHRFFLFLFFPFHGDHRFTATGLLPRSRGRAGPELGHAPERGRRCAGQPPGLQVASGGRWTG